MKPADMIHEELSLTNPNFLLVANLMATRLDFQEQRLLELERQGRGATPADSPDPPSAAAEEIRHGEPPATRVRKAKGKP
jgi:hypothetical protein